MINKYAVCERNNTVSISGRRADEYRAGCNV